MKILVNPRPPELAPPPEGWQLFRQPKPRLALLLSILAGLTMPCLPFVLLTFQNWLDPRASSSAQESVHAWIVIPVVLVSVVLHEGLHLLGHPGGGWSPHSLLLFWPGRLSLGVYYEGAMARTRWLVMRLLPLFGLVLLPVLVLFAAYPDRIPFFWRQFIVLVVLVNSLGAGGDLVASIIVARQALPGATIANWNGRAYWKTPGGQAVR
jgi:hypothetical protein